MTDRASPRQRREPRYRRLVRCPDCSRQFDGGALAPGERFHCVCGATLQVPRSAPQDAPVVRCASCGAPRAAHAGACTFCEAPFELGEAQRNTLCPVCVARIGDAQRFCHGCGTLIAPETVAGGPTEFPCPSCKPERKLASRRISDDPAALAMLECGRCAGVWLGHRAFETLGARARPGMALASQARPAEAARPRGSGTSKRTTKVVYRPCPLCSKLMVRRNFGGISGVVVDVCSADGLWFDAGELDDVLAWIRGGGLARSEQRQREENEEVARRLAAARMSERPAPREESSGGRWLEVLSTLADFLLGALSRSR
jgi:Zn-finger nucleic acid-binding protein